MGQLVDEIKPNYDSKVNFLVVFVDEEKEQPVASEFNVQYVPMTIIFDKNGNEKETFINLVAKDKLTGVLDDLVK